MRLYIGLLTHFIASISTNDLLKLLGMIIVTIALALLIGWLNETLRK